MVAIPVRLPSVAATTTIPSTGMVRQIAANTPEEIQAQQGGGGNNGGGDGQAQEQDNDGGGGGNQCQCGSGGGGGGGGHGISSNPIKKAPMASAGNNAYVVWWSNKSGDWEVLFRASSDNGKTFGPKINLSNSTGRSADGKIAAEENNVYVVWWDNQPGNNEVFFRASSDNGKTFGSKINLSNNNATSDSEQLATADNNVYVVWKDNETGNNDIFFRPSTDNGKTFGPKINLSNSTTSSADAMIDAEGNNVYVSWWERANNQTAIREPVMRVSNDNGKTFGGNIMPSSNGTTVSGGKSQ